IFLEEMKITEQQFRAFDQVRIVACGTSWHAGLAGKFMIEELGRLRTEVDYGSEFRYRNPIVDERTLTVCISQSGETADTLPAHRFSLPRPRDPLSDRTRRRAQAERDFLYSRRGIPGGRNETRPERPD